MATMSVKSGQRSYKMRFFSAALLFAGLVTTMMLHGCRKGSDTPAKDTAANKHTKSKKRKGGPSTITTDSEEDPKKNQKTAHVGGTGGGGGGGGGNRGGRLPPPPGGGGGGGTPRGGRLPPLPGGGGGSGNRETPLPRSPVVGTEWTSNAGTKYRIQTVPGDGTCFFHSIVQAMNMNENDNVRDRYATGDELRTAYIQYVTREWPNNPEITSLNACRNLQCVVKLNDVNLEEFQARMLKNAWGDLPDAVLIAEMTRIEIVIHQEMATKTAERLRPQNPIATVEILHRGNHYDVLQRV